VPDRGFYFGREPVSELWDVDDADEELELDPVELLPELAGELDGAELEPEDDEWELPDELDPDDDPELPLELDDEDPELWSEPCCEEPELPALRVAPASGSPRWPFPFPSLSGGFLETGGFFGGLLYGGSGCFLW
jgi:hypothetical protein